MHGTGDSCCKYSSRQEELEGRETKDRDLMYLQSRAGAFAQEELAATNMELFNLGQALQSLKVKLGSMSTERDELKMKLGSTCSERDELMVKLGSMSTERDELKVKLGSTCSEREELKVKLGSTCSERDTLKGSLAEAQLVSHCTSGRLQQLQAELQGCEARSSNLQASMQACEARLSNLQAQLVVEGEARRAAQTGQQLAEHKAQLSEAAMAEWRRLEDDRKKLMQENDLQQRHLSQVSPRLPVSSPLSCIPLPRHPGQVACLLLSCRAAAEAACCCGCV